MSQNELRNKFNIDPSITSCYSLVYSYAKDSTEPIIFSHYIHEHIISSPISYAKDNSYCTLFIILSGELSFVFENSVYKPTYGNAIVIRNREKYTTCFNTNSLLDYYEINFPVEFFEKIHNSNPFYNIFYNRESGKFNMVILDKLNCESAIGKLKKIEKLINANKDFNDMLIYSYIMQIMGIINRTYDETIDIFPVTKIPHKLKTAIDYMHSNYAAIECISDVANYCNVTETYLARIFKKFLLCTPVEYITNLKISNAKYLLSQDYTLTDACFKSGFNDYSYFIKKFKEYAGITPSKFQKEQTEE